MKRLPGDPSAKRQVARMIRVDHAGEYGAKRIYDGQLAVLGRLVRFLVAPAQLPEPSLPAHVQAEKLRPVIIWPPSILR